MPKKSVRASAVRPEHSVGPDMMRKLSRLAMVSAMPAVLAACAVTTPVDVTATLGALPGATSVEVAPFSDDDSMRDRFGTALTDAFADANVRVATDSPVIAEFAIAERSATSGVADPEASSDEAIVWSSEPRDNDLLDKCVARRMRGTLVLLSRTDGSLLYRGVAESTDCDFEDSHFAAMANALVADARTR